MTVQFSAESLEWFRTNYGGDYDNERFEKIATWIQKQPVAKRFNTGDNLPLLKYYHDVTVDIPEFTQIEFNNNHTVFTIMD